MIMMVGVCWKFLWSLLLSVCLVVRTCAFQNSPCSLAFGSACGRNKGSTKPLFLLQNSIETQNICVLVEEDEEVDEFREEATAIANNLGIPIVSTLESSSSSSSSNNVNDDEIDSEESNDQIRFTHALRLVPYNSNDDKVPSTFALGIEPIEPPPATDNDPRKKKRKPKKSPPPFFVDLAPPSNSKAGRRAAGSSGQADLLVKAVAPARCPGGAVVWDLTAGLGQDSLVLAKNGAKQVTMVERNPIVAALLEDAMRRLKETDQELSAMLNFAMGEAREILQKDPGTDCCDVIYLDPMFPPRQKQSAVKKGMSILHGLLETHVVTSEDDEATGRRRQEEEQELLEASLKVAKLRVVVKRPAKAPLLGNGNIKPSHALTGSVNRWDVYVTKPPSD